EAAQSLGDDANLLMIIQVPLKYREPVRRAMKSMSPLDSIASDKPAASAAPAEAQRKRATSDVEAAVLGHGPELGPYTELDGLTIERDPRFPLPVAVQFYQPTPNGPLAAGA